MYRIVFVLPAVLILYSHVLSSFINPSYVPFPLSTWALFTATPLPLADFAVKIEGDQVACWMQECPTFNPRMQGRSLYLDIQSYGQDGTANAAAQLVARYLPALKSPNMQVSLYRRTLIPQDYFRDPSRVQLTLVNTQKLGGGL